ncbi:MAG: hypothetical protein MRY32_00535 [Rickettsiales bacterium]|nr:hypothetical protein [Rickettsiales bacterium]
MKYILISFVCLLAACSSAELSTSSLSSEATLGDYTVPGEALKSLPAAARKPVVSVYSFQDLTGQHKPADNLAEYSRAVTQGGADIVAQALMDAGDGNWFTVVERKGLNNLLQERKIIRAMRNNYQGEDGVKLSDIPAMLYSGILIEGGIVAYESNIMTGGFGARYLAIGGSTEYRRDIVTVYLRAISVSNGEVLLSTNASKTIFSTVLQGGVFKYIGLNELLEIESGFSLNEPPQFATRQAIEMAVYSMIVEGAAKGLWGFEDQAAGEKVVTNYQTLKHEKQAEFVERISPTFFKDDGPSLTSFLNRFYDNGFNADNVVE